MMPTASVQSAVAFLRDPAVQDSPLHKRVAFLEAKGVSSSDIDAALRLAAAGPNPFAGANANANILGSGVGPLRYYAGPGQYAEPGRWKDYFIMAVVGGGVGTILWSLARVGTSSLIPPKHSNHGH